MLQTGSDHRIQLDRLPWPPVSRHGLELMRRHPVLRAIGLWLLEQSPGLRALLLHQFQPGSATGYRRWAALHDTLHAADHAAIRQHAARLPARVISVVTTTTGQSPDSIRDLLATMRAQLWPHWELCVASVAPSPAMAEALAAVADEPRARVVLCGAGVGAVAAWNAASAVADGAYLALLAPGGRLREHALYEVAAALAEHPATAVVYADEDLLDGLGQRHTPRFKPDFSPDLLLGEDLFGGFTVWRADTLRRLGGPDEAFGAQAGYDLALRASSELPAGRIRHIPAVLSHHATAPEPPGEAGRRAAQRHLDRALPGAIALPNPKLPGHVRVRPALPTPAPPVTLIVPTRDHAGLLAQSTAGLLQRTDYPALELLIVDNGSTAPDAVALLARLARAPRVRVLRCPGPFNFAALNNRAVAAARGEVVVLVNNDIDVIEPGWLAELVAHALRPDVGVVGAKLLYRDGRVQHGGVALGVGGIAGHLELLADRSAPGYGGRLALTRDVSAVTGACMALRRDLYLALGGMNERDLAIAYNDIDLCLRVRARGLRVVWTPFAELIHLGSGSRVSDLTAAQLPRFQREAAYMRRTWGAVLAEDPFYGPNFSLRDGHYRLTTPRRVRPWQTRQQPALTRGEPVGAPA